MPNATDRASIALARAAAACAAVCINAVFWGCSADRPLNPSFPLTYDGARADLARMREHRLPLQRPLIVCAGIFDPGAGSRYVSDQLRGMTTTPELVLDTGFWGCGDFEACRARAIGLVTQRFSNAGSDTVPVDAIGVSMGGIVARFAALPRDRSEPPGPRLNIQRLFTLGSPHHGAAWWDYASWDQRATNMRPGCAFMRRLDLAWRQGLDAEAGPRKPPYEIIPYVRLGDTIVGETNAAGPDGQVWWVSNPALEFAHMQAFDDPRLLADLARRLRGETPWTTEPPAPLPALAER